MITPNDRLESFLGDFQEVPVILGATAVIDKPSKNRSAKGISDWSCSCDTQCRCDDKCSHCFCNHDCSCERYCPSDCGCEDHCPDSCKSDYNP